MKRIYPGYKIILSKYLFSTILLMVPYISQAIPSQYLDTAGVSIHIQALPPFFNLKPFWIDIYKREHSIKVVYSLEDSIAYKLMYKDQDFISADGIYNSMLHNDSLFTSWNKHKKDSLYEKLNSLYRKYAVCKVDSISFGINTNIKYRQLLEEIVKTNKDGLENTAANKERVVFDGASFEFIIQSGSIIKTVSARAPDSESYPLLYQLLEATLNAYRGQKNNDFLDKQKTYGY